MGHVRVFSPWSYNIDTAARALLVGAGWDAPEPADFPTGSLIVGRYLEPLAALPEIARNLRLGAVVSSVTRQGLSKVTSIGRQRRPFVIRHRDAAGIESEAPVRAVIDATGTWSSPNPMGIDGLPVPGEVLAVDRIAYGMPDLLGAAIADYAGKRVLVVGSGHSAINVVLALLRLRESETGTSVLWALRRAAGRHLFGGGAADMLPARGEIGLAAKEALEAGAVELLAPFSARRVEMYERGLRIAGDLGSTAVTFDVDRVVVCTGFRPDVTMTRELRVSLDPVLEAPPELAPLIDPNVHSCGSAAPHGAAELRHPEPDFYVVGAKSYGRAPTFLMATGYEQVRSVVAELAGDQDAARQVRLVLPETGVCSGAPEVREASGQGCCGGPAKADTAACCVADEQAKTAGQSGCGCGGAAVPARSQHQPA